MKAFDCFVLSSIQEAFGRVLLEAMLARLPLIATRVNGIPEVLGKTGGTLVEAKNMGEMARAMQAVYEQSDEKRGQLGQQAYEHALAHFSIPVFKQQFWGNEHLSKHLGDAR